MIRLRLFLTFLLVALVVVIIRAATSKQTPFSDLEEGDQFFLGHPAVGWHKFTKQGGVWATTTVQPCEGMPEGHAVRVRPEHRVTRIAKDEEWQI